MARLQKGYFSRASTDARNVATSSNDVSRRFMRANSQKPTPSSVTTTLRGVKSASTAELGSDLRARASTARAVQDHPNRGIVQPLVAATAAQLFQAGHQGRAIERFRHV